MRADEPRAILSNNNGRTDPMNKLNARPPVEKKKG
jgi:hypothetical protein